MNESEIRQIVEKQRAYFYTGATLPLDGRIRALKKLRTYIQEHEAELNEAIRKDLGKSAYESFMCETGLVLTEITYMLKHVRSFAREKTVYTPLAQFHSRSYQKTSPYGVTLIMSPWNYPFMLALEPVIGAIAAGNCGVVKPSAYAPATSAVIAGLLRRCFSPHFVAAVEGGRAENTKLLEQKFDFIFFTGSKAVGQLVMEKAAHNLTPVCLELGGKSPCIVDETANLRLAARRIVFGKYLNLGQTCVAPDYLFVQESVKEPLLREIERCIYRQFGADPLKNPDYGKMINEKHFQRVCRLMESGVIRTGGAVDTEHLRIAPTVLTDIRPSDPVMQEEIFGPLLPVLTFRDISEVITYVNGHDKPLALYLFTRSRATGRKVLGACSFGGGCINDTIIHLATSRMPFGGVGASGMGGYHGKASFDLFSHRRSIVKKYNWIDLPIRYQPYTSWKRTLLELFLR